MLARDWHGQLCNLEGELCVFGFVPQETPREGAFHEGAFWGVFLGLELKGSE